MAKEAPQRQRRSGRLKPRTSQWQMMPTTTPTTTLTNKPRHQHQKGRRLKRLRPRLPILLPLLKNHLPQLTPLRPLLLTATPRHPSLPLPQRPKPQLHQKQRPPLEPRPQDQHQQHPQRLFLQSVWTHHHQHQWTAWRTAQQPSHPHHNPFRP